MSTASPRADRPRVDRPRATALAVLRAVRERDAYVNLELPRLLRERGLGGRDAAFATELTHGTIRRQGTYDAVLEACLDRPIARLDPDTHDVLRLGCHQLLLMRTPAHAAVSTSVAMARSARGPGAGRLVNAVLRRVAGRDLDGWLAEVAPDAATDPDGHLAVVHSHPVWIVRAMREALADDPTALLEADNAAPAVTLVARPGLVDVEELVGAGATPGRWSPYAAVLAGGDPGAIPAVRDGRAGVQDEGSQLVVLALAAAPVQGRDERWLDLCAGPGGKAALLGALAAPRGARVVAQELAPHRADLVRQTVGAARRHGRGAHRRRSRGGRRRAGRLRPGARRRARAPASGRCAVVRRPVGAASRATSRGSAGCSASCWPRRSTPPVPAAWSPTSPAHPTWRRPATWSPTSSAPGTTSSRSTPPPCCRSCPRSPAPPCSCGRTCTAPTRCSAPCSAAADAAMFPKGPRENVTTAGWPPVRGDVNT